MDVKRSSGHGKPDFLLTQGPVTGSVALAVKAARTRASYDWEYSLDEISWIRADSTVLADTELYGLEAGTGYFFRHRVVTKAGVGDWSQVLSLFVR